MNDYVKCKKGTLQFDNYCFHGDRLRKEALYMDVYKADNDYI